MREQEREDREDVQISSDLAQMSDKVVKNYIRERMHQIELVRIGWRRVDTTLCRMGARMGGDGSGEENLLVLTTAMKAAPMQTAIRRPVPAPAQIWRPKSDQREFGGPQRAKTRRLTWILILLTRRFLRCS